MPQPERRDVEGKKDKDWNTEIGRGEEEREKSGKYVRSDGLETGRVEWRRSAEAIFWEVKEKRWI